MKICYNCFHTANDSFRFCEKCGSPLDSRNTAAWPEALECGTTLYGRYLIGNVLQQDDSSITYAAQDSRTKGRVAVREYFPRACSARTSMRTVSVSEEHRDEYLEGKDLFLQNAETLANETDSDQPPCVQSYFNQNDTAYLVVDYGSQDHLMEFLEGKGFRGAGAEPARASAGRPSQAESPAATPAPSATASPAPSPPPSAAENTTPASAGPIAGYSADQGPLPFRESGAYEEDSGKSAVSQTTDSTQPSEGDHYFTGAAPSSIAAAADPSPAADAVQNSLPPEDRSGSSGSSGGYYPGTLPGESINVPHGNPVSGPALNSENVRPRDPAPDDLWHDVPGSLPGAAPGSAEPAGPGAGKGSSAYPGPGVEQGSYTGPGMGAEQGSSSGSGAGRSRKNSMLPIAFILGVLALCLVTIMLLIPRISLGSRDFRYFIYSIQRQIHRKREFFERRPSQPDDTSDGGGSGIEDIFGGNGSEKDGTEKDKPIRNPFEDLLKDDKISDDESAKAISSGNYYNKGYYALLGSECFFSDARGLYRGSYDNIENAEKVGFEPSCYLNPYGGRIYYLNEIDNKIRCFDPESETAYDVYDYEDEQGYKPESLCIHEDWCYFSCKNTLYRFSMEEVSGQSPLPSPLHSQDVETVLEDFNAENHIFPSLCFVDGSMVYIGNEGIVAAGPDGSRKKLSSRKGRLFSSGSALYIKYGINEIYRLSLDGNSTQIINAKSGSFITNATCIGDWIYYSLETEEKIELWRLSSDGDQNEYIADLGSKEDTLISICAFRASDGENADDESSYVYTYLLSKKDSGLTPVHEAFIIKR